MTGSSEAHARRTFLCGTATAVLLLLVPAASAGGSGHLFGGPSGTIAFEAADGLYVVDAAGGQPRRIPGTKPGDGDPVFSPDGTRVSFDRKQDAHRTDYDAPRDVYVMHSDGSELRRLTHSPADDGWAVWAPNGRSLAFYSERGGISAVYAMNVAAGAARFVAFGDSPQWTSAGRILFTRDGGIYTVRPYGADKRPLANQPGDAMAARLSPDGQFLVFTTNRAYQPGDEDDDVWGFFDLYIARGDGSRATPLHASPSSEENDPEWSPDSGWIAYDAPAALEGMSDIYLIRPDGTTNTRLTMLGGACCASWHAGALLPENPPNT